MTSCAKSYNIKCTWHLHDIIKKHIISYMMTGMISSFHFIWYWHYLWYHAFSDGIILSIIYMISCMILQCDIMLQNSWYYKWYQMQNHMICEYLYLKKGYGIIYDIGYDIDFIYHMIFIKLKISMISQFCPWYYMHYHIYDIIHTILHMIYYDIKEAYHDIIEIYDIIVAQRFQMSGH